jgi:hypothetical protein
MCNEWRPRRLPLVCGDFGYVAEGAEGGRVAAGGDTGEVGDVGDVGVVGTKTAGLEAVVLGDGEEGEYARVKVSGAKRSGRESCMPEGCIESVQVQKKRAIDAVLDVVEARGFVMDPNLVGLQVEGVGTTESQRGRS